VTLMSTDERALSVDAARPVHLAALLAIPIAAAVQIVLRDWWANRGVAPETS
jgi:hypothetical protein